MTPATPTGSEAVRLVPVELTPAMVRAANEATEAGGGFREAWSAMISAVPSVSAPEREAVEETIRLVEYDMLHRPYGGGGFVGQQGEVAALIQALRLALTGTGAGEGSRYITVWRTVDDALAWDFYVSENEREAGEVVVNLTRRGVTKATTYPIGNAVGSLSIPARATTIRSTTHDE